MRSSFLDYAMSVIVSRALPDVRDGLKPVHRRVLYSMHDSGLQPNRPRVKSARSSATVMGQATTRTATRRSTTRAVRLAQTSRCATR